MKVNCKFLAILRSTIWINTLEPNLILILNESLQMNLKNQVLEFFIVFKIRSHATLFCILLQ